MLDYHVVLFGTPQIKRGDERLSIQRKKDLALLIYLLMNSQAQSRDALASLLWPELNQADARSNLRKSLSRLKISLGGNALLISSDQINFHPGFSIQLDVKEFQARLERFRQHHAIPGQRLCPDCRQALEEAANLYRADFLSGFLLPDSSTFEEWRYFQAETLRQNLAEALRQLAREYTAEGNYEAAISYTRKWLALDNLHEPAQRQLMLLYALNGQPAAAKRQFEECVRLLEEELHTQPEPETLQLFDAIQKKKFNGPAQDLILPSQLEEQIEHPLLPALPNKKVHFLPSYPSPFIGREKELDDISRLLGDPSCRLLTLLGPGGSGKTRLALQTATRLGDHAEAQFQDGIYFLSLAPLTDPEAIVGALIGTLGITGQVRGANPREKLFGYLQGRRFLLILDNFEHLLCRESTTMISELIGAAGQCKFLVTSRERLNLQGEQIFRVEGLETPEERPALLRPEVEAQAFSALQLFEHCAARVQPSFTISHENYEAISRICRRVQGMPLAIEMAASWLEIFTPEEIQLEIDRSLDFLQSNLRDLPERQRSLRAVFDSSWSLLDRQTRPVLKALSVFRAGFTREAAQAVAGASAKSLLDLTNKSWLQRLASGRYQIHELLRQFCYEKLLQETVTFEQVKRQYCEHYASHASSLWAMMKGRNQKQAFSIVGEELENFHMAWAWLVEKNEIATAVDKLLPALFYYSEMRRLALELLDILENTLNGIWTKPDTPELRRWKIILGTAEASFYGDGSPLRYSFYEGVGFGIHVDPIQKIWSMLEMQGASQHVGIWGIRLALVYGNYVDHAVAIHFIEEALPGIQQTNDSWELAMAHLYLAKLQLAQLGYNRDSEADIERHILEAVHRFTLLGDDLNASYALLQLGSLRLKQERLDEAVEQWNLAYATYIRLDEWILANNVIRLMGDAYVQSGHFPASFKCYDQIARNCLEHGFAQNAVEALSKESYEMVRHGDLAEALRIRQECIEIIQATGPEYQLAWNFWEMGEIHRVLGDHVAALEWYEKARRIFNTFPDDGSNTFYFRGIADLALSKGDFALACQHFGKSIQLAYKARHDWAMAYALNGLGRAELGLHKVNMAREHFLEAMRYAFKTGDHGITLVTLAGYAELMYAEEQFEMAVQFGSLVCNHYAAWNETKELMSGILSSLKKGMAAAGYEQAERNGRVLNLWDTVGNLIDWQKPQITDWQEFSKAY